MGYIALNWTGAAYAVAIWTRQRIGPRGIEVPSTSKGLLLYFSGEKRIRKMSTKRGGEKIKGIKALKKSVFTNWSLDCGQVWECI